MCLPNFSSCMFRNNSLVAKFLRVLISFAVKHTEKDSTVVMKNFKKFSLPKCLGQNRDESHLIELLSLTFSFLAHVGKLKIASYG